MASKTPRKRTRTLTGIERALEVAQERWPDKPPHVAIAYHLGVSAQVIYNWQKAGGVVQTGFAVALGALTGIPVEEFIPPREKSAVA